MRLFHKLKKYPANTINELLDELKTQCAGDLYFPRMMNVEDINTCVSHGTQIGSHGISHTILSGEFGNEILRRELYDSKAILEKLFGQPVNSFAFPAGGYDAR